MGIHSTCAFVARSSNHCCLLSRSLAQAPFSLLLVSAQQHRGGIITFTGLFWAEFTSLPFLPGAQLRGLAQWQAPVDASTPALVPYALRNLSGVRLVATTGAVCAALLGKAR